MMARQEELVNFIHLIQLFKSTQQQQQQQQQETFVDREKTSDSGNCPANMKSFLIRDILSNACFSSSSRTKTNNSNTNDDHDVIDVECLSDSSCSSSNNNNNDTNNNTNRAHTQTAETLAQQQLLAAGTLAQQQLLAAGKQLSPDSFHHSQLNSPLDALFQMTSSTFEALKRGEKRKDRETDGQHGSTNFTGKQTPKKKRKSRTAFTNNQIYELERRFRIQKYLSPTDRDEIAMTLNLSNAQVITWFQNRRAKMKRDLEEQKRDIETASLVNLHRTLLESFQALSQMKTATNCNLNEEEQEG